MEKKTLFGKMSTILYTSLFVVSQSLLAQDFKAGGLYYYISGDEAIVTFPEGLDRNMKPQQNSYTGEITIPETVTHDGKTYVVSIIGYWAFANSSVEKFKFPKSLRNIENGAFYNTPWFNAHPEGGVYVNDIFYKYKGDDSPGLVVTIKDGTTGIADYAFAEMKNLKWVEIPESVTRMGTGVFHNCTGLKGFPLSKNTTKIPNLTYRWNEQTTCEIPDWVMSVGQMAYAQMFNLERVTIPRSLIEICGNAFQWCSNLKEMRVYTSVPPKILYSTTFQDIDFDKCILYVPMGSIEKYQYGAWSSFKNIVEFDAGEKTLPTLMNDGVTYEVTSSNTVTLTDGKSIKGICVIPSIAEYNNSRFVVFSIGEGAFEGNKDLTEVFIPEDGPAIGIRAFAGCTNLSAIYSYSVWPPGYAGTRNMTRADGSSQVFTEEENPIFTGVNKETCIVYVPVGCVDIYRKSLVFGGFKNIAEMSSTGINTFNEKMKSFDVFDLYGRKIKSKVSSIEGLPSGH